MFSRAWSSEIYFGPIWHQFQDCLVVQAQFWCLIQAFPKPSSNWLKLHNLLGSPTYIPWSFQFLRNINPLEVEYQYDWWQYTIYHHNHLILTDISVFIHEPFSMLTDGWRNTKTYYYLLWTLFIIICELRGWFMHDLHIWVCVLTINLFFLFL